MFYIPTHKTLYFPLCNLYHPTIKAKELLFLPQHKRKKDNLLKLVPEDNQKKKKGNQKETSQGGKHLSHEE